MIEKFTPKEIELFFENISNDLLYSWSVMQFEDEKIECYDLAIKIYKHLAEQGHALALNNLGALHSEGRFVHKDTQKAFDYYVNSAENGCMEACCNLGYFYLYGRNGEVDYKKAFEYFSKGAILGNDANCFYKLGDMYMYGSYVEKNPDIAFNYYVRAAKTLEEYGSTYVDELESDINYRIGKCLYYGNGIEEDKLLASQYLENALRGYKNRIHDAYNYVEKRIQEIKDMIAKIQ